MKVKVVTLENKAAGEIELNDAVFGLPERADILQRMVEYQRAKARQGTHKTKTISEISGRKAKPFKQKGGGRARQGSLRSAQFRGGATIFGPVVRSHAIDLPKKVRKLALKTALSVKAAAGELMIVDSLSFDKPKTAEMKQKLTQLGVSSVLFVDGNAVNEGFKKSVANLVSVDVLPQIGANVYDILRHDNLVLTKEAVQLLEERLQ
ncbi:50S ribosomal protein L4 [bacterium]|nr:50S ribosomal protein L4 [bacterium]